MSEPDIVTTNVTPLRRPSTRKSVRARNAERQRRYRARKAAGTTDPGVTSTVRLSPSPNGTAVAVRKAGRDAAAVTAPQNSYVTRLTTPVECVVEAGPSVPTRVAAASPWSTVGRAGVGLAIIGTGAFIAFTSMRANSWFGHSLTPDPVAGEVYSHLSVAAEVIACLIPTAARFYWLSGEWWTALRGWALMAVALVVASFAAGGFAVTNLNAGVETRAERSTGEIDLAQRRVDTLAKSRADECRKRGERWRKLEAHEQGAIAELERLRADVRAEADPAGSSAGHHFGTATRHPG